MAQRARVGGWTASLRRVHRRFRGPATLLAGVVLLGIFWAIDAGEDSADIGGGLVLLAGLVLTLAGAIVTVLDRRGR